MGLDFTVSEIFGFEWDKGNLDKNRVKHKVTNEESEEVFANQPVRIFDDEVHSKGEKRYGALGKTNKGRRLTVFFTIRKNRVRIISAHDQGRKDKRLYKEIEEQFQKEAR